MADIFNAIAIIVIGFIILLRPWKRQEYDGRMMPDGTVYRFSVGDNLLHYGSSRRFRGMSIELPKRMPHIYLDSQKGGGIKADYIIDNSQRISLEGNFDDYFQLYAPEHAKTLALSVISPDVMQTLMPLAGNYDIELHYDRLNIISAKPVYRSRVRQLEMQHIMEVVLEELSHRFKSWPAAYEAPVEDRLMLQTRGGTRILGRYVSLRLVLMNSVLFGLALFVMLLGIGYILFSKGSLGGLLFGFVLLLLAGLLSYLLYTRNTKRSSRFRPNGWWYIRPPRHKN